MESSITYHKDGGVTFSGPDAVAFVRAATLVSSLRLYAKVKIIPMRGVTITKMLAMATGITKKRYKRGDAEKAAADVEAWAREMKAALPQVEA